MDDTNLMNHTSQKAQRMLHHNDQILHGGKKTDFCYQCKETFLLTKKQVTLKDVTEIKIKILP